jgi:outer membrane protein OmpU
MKKTLLATTAVAAVALASGDALAQASAAGPVRLGLGGYFEFYGVGAEQSNGTGQPGAFTHNFDFKREGEIYFTGQTKLDNGLIIGAQVELEAEPESDQIDESYIWFQGNWGRLTLGSENAANYLLSVGAPTVDSAFDGQDPNYVLYNKPAGAGDARVLNASSIDTSVSRMTGDSEKITYQSPRIFGFRAGVSYTPDNSEEGTTGQVAAKPAALPPNNTIGQHSNVIEAGLNYEGKLGPVELLAGVGGGYGFLESDNVAGTLKDRQAYHGGVDVGFAGFHVGASYYWDDNGISDGGIQRTFAAGLTYTIGPLTVGGSYFNSDRDRGTFAADEELSRYLVGARYVLGPGVSLRGSVHYYDYEGGAASTLQNEAWMVVVGTRLDF